MLNGSQNTAQLIWAAAIFLPRQRTRGAAACVAKGREGLFSAYLGLARLEVCSDYQLVTLYFLPAF
jgi:hypothetical protein